MEFAAEGPMAIPLWINGHAYLSVGESFFDVINPQSGQALRRVPLCGADEAAAAVAAARAAQPQWAEMGLNARRVCLNALADALERYAGHFAKLLGQEIAMDDGAAAHVADDAVDVEVARRHLAGDPHAVVVDAQKPLSSAAAALAPALLAGAAIVLKPSPRAPGALYALCELSARSDWPAGVLNLLHGDTAAIRGLCAAGVDRLLYRGHAALGEQVGALVGETATAFELQAV